MPHSGTEGIGDDADHRGDQDDEADNDH